MTLDQYDLLSVYRDRLKLSWAAASLVLLTLERRDYLSRRDIVDVVFRLGNPFNTGLTTEWLIVSVKCPQTQLRAFFRANDPEFAPILVELGLSP